MMLSELIGDVRLSLISRSSATSCSRSLRDDARVWLFIFFFQAEDGIRDRTVTGVQTCALPISTRSVAGRAGVLEPDADLVAGHGVHGCAGQRDRSEERRVGKECRSRGRRDD